jgi:hypothetical protein
MRAGMMSTTVLPQPRRAVLQIATQPFADGGCRGDKKASGALDADLTGRLRQSQPMVLNEGYTMNLSDSTNDIKLTFVADGFTIHSGLPQCPPRVSGTF